MATPKPGEIRCPTCHRSTPPAAFCTQCGSAIPSDARIRPRGMDRDELQERIRARRSGGDPYRRGNPADEEPPGYHRYEPEPEDARARPGQPGDGRRRDRFEDAPPPVHAPSADTSPDEPRRDLTRDQDDEWATGTAAAAAGTTAPREPIGGPGPEEPAHVDNFDDAAYAGEGYYEYDTWEDERERRSGGGALAILGFLALGVVALLGGAMLAGIFGDDSGVGQNPSPSATPSLSAAPTNSPAASPTSDATSGESPDATGEPPGDGEPVVFPDGFVAKAQPCLPGSADLDGCDSNGERNSGSVQIWVGFQGGTDEDVIGSELIGPQGNTLGTGSIDLDDINCGTGCNGYTYFNYSNLEPGTYQVEITRSGQLADSITFEVE